MTVEVFPVCIINTSNQAVSSSSTILSEFLTVKPKFKQVGLALYAVCMFQTLVGCIKTIVVSQRMKYAGFYTDKSKINVNSVLEMQMLKVASCLSVSVSLRAASFITRSRGQWVQASRMALDPHCRNELL